MKVHDKASIHPGGGAGPKNVRELVIQCKRADLASYLAKESHLPGRMANLTLAAEVQGIFKDAVSQVGFQKFFNLAIYLESHDHEYVRMVAARAFGALAKDHYREVLPHLKTLSNDDSWRVREGAAEGIGQSLCFHFDPVYKELQGWVKSGQPNLQRAAAVGMISMMSYDEPLMKDKTPQILDLLEELLTVGEEYVFKNTSFALNIAGWKNPEVILARMEAWLKEKRVNTSPIALRIFVNSLDTRFGQQNARRALTLLTGIDNRLSGIEDRKESQRISAAVAKVREKLSKKV